MNNLSIEELKSLREAYYGMQYEKIVAVLDELIAIREMKGDQVPVAYITSDGKMLIFADSPNMLPEDKSSLTPLFKRDKKTGSNDDCLSCDRHYVDGMKAGWNFHEGGDNQGFIDSIDRVQKDMREARKEQVKNDA